MVAKHFQRSEVFCKGLLSVDSVAEVLPALKDSVQA